MVEGGWGAAGRPWSHGAAGSGRECGGRWAGGRHGTGIGMGCPTAMEHGRAPTPPSWESTIYRVTPRAREEAHVFTYTPLFLL